jgi:thioredoxin reductase (NADPH)
MPPEPRKTSPPRHDCVVIGGGPAGLVAATYLARFKRDVVLLDADRSRARYIPRTHNCPGFPDGIGGSELLQRLRAQAGGVGVVPRAVRVASIAREADGFQLATDADPLHARTVIVATGLVDRLPAWQGIEAAIESGVLRLCPVCDAYEVRHQRLAVYGRGRDCVAHAAYLRTWSKHVVAMHPPGEPPQDEQVALAGELGIGLLPVDEADCRLEAEALVVAAPDGPQRFEVVYVALGTEARTALIAALGPDTDDNDELRIDAHCRSSIPGLYAIGDAVSALNQLSVAFGHAAIAASAVHRALPRNPL